MRMSYLLIPVVTAALFSLGSLFAIIRAKDLQSEMSRPSEHFQQTLDRLRSTDEPLSGGRVAATIRQLEDANREQLEVVFRLMRTLMFVGFVGFIATGASAGVVLRQLWKRRQVN